MEEERWSSGRPVFKKVDGQPRFLFVQERNFNDCAWAISDAVKDNGAFIISGRATNSPTSAVAGISVREGVTSWRYRANGKWMESYGDISVSCEEWSVSRGRREVSSDETAGNWLEGDVSIISP